MIIDYASKPPTGPFNPPQTGHLDNYRRVYQASESRVEKPQDEQTALAEYLQAYEAVGAAHVVVKARDNETTFGLKVRNEDVADSAGSMAPASSASPGSTRTRGWRQSVNLKRRCVNSVCGG